MTISIQKEGYETCFEEIKILAAEAWEEVGHGGLAKKPPEPDSEMYKKLSEKGAVFAATVRDDGVLIGYCSLFLTDLLHHKGVKQAFCDSIFLKKSRRGRLSLAFIHEIKKIAREAGAHNLDFHVTAAVDFGRLMEETGGVMTSRTYSMELTDA